MRKKICTAIISIFLLLSILHITSTNLTEAQLSGYISITENGSIVGTNAITKINEVFTFTGNIAASAFFIQKSNIIIDGAGYTFNSDRKIGDNLYSRGIILSEVSNVTITNLKISNGSSNIELNNAINCTIASNILVDSESYAIQITSSTGNSLINNSITGSYNGGIRLTNSKNNYLINNNIKDNGNGIYIEYSSENIFKGNVLQNNTGYSSNLQIAFSQTSDLDNDIDTSNIIDGKPIYYWQNIQDKTVPSDAGYLVLSNCTRIIAKDLTVQAVILASTSNSTLTNITIENEGDTGILLASSSQNIISNCSLRLNTRGFQLKDSEYNTITRCTIACYRGINLDHSNFNVFSNNNFAGSKFAVEHYDISTLPFKEAISTGNVFYENTFAQCETALTISINYTIHNNYFTGNRQAVVFLRGNNNLTGNNFTVNQQAIYLDGADNTLRDNHIDNNDKSLVIGGLELFRNYLGYVPPVIYSNDIDDSNTVNGKPIYFWTDVKDKTVPNDAAFVVLIRCNNITIQNLNLTNNPQGIILFNTRDATIKENYLAENEIGIGLFGAYNCEITENYLTANSLGMRIDSAHSNRIVNNTFIENNGFAILFSGSQKNNVIIHNNFIKNKSTPNLQVSIDKWYGPGLSNIWNDTNQGNYWSDYFTRYTNASESSSTNTGNTPFVINENNIDQHPFIKPYNNITIIPNQPTPTPTLTPTQTPQQSPQTTPTPNHTPTTPASTSPSQTTPNHATPQPTQSITQPQDIQPELTLIVTLAIIIIAIVIVTISLKKVNRNR